MGDGEEVHDFALFVVPVVGLRGRVVLLAAADGLGLLSDVVAVDLAVATTGVEAVDVGAAPFD